jgi:hypothetical protein
MVGLLGCGCCDVTCPPAKTGWDFRSLPQSTATTRYVQETWDSIPALNGNWQFCSSQTVNGVLRQFGAASLLFNLSDPPANQLSPIFSRADYRWDMTVPQVPSATTSSAVSEIWTGPVINWQSNSSEYGYCFIVRYSRIAGMMSGTKTYTFTSWTHITQCGQPVANTGDIPPGAVFTVGSGSVSEFWSGTAISETIEAFGNWNLAAGTWDIELKAGGSVKIRANGAIPEERRNDRACFGEFFLNASAVAPFSTSPSPTLPTHDNTLIRYTYQ